MVRIDSNSSGSNYKFQDKLELPRFPRSQFDLSHVNLTDIKSIGQLMPVALFECLPTDSFQLGVNALLRVLPQKVPLYSSQRLTVHAFYSSCSSLWRDWQVFIRKGYTGNEILEVPVLTNENTGMNDNDVIDNSHLFHYLYDIPVGTKFGQIKGKINAMPALMYFKIWLLYFANRNFYISDRKYFPNDEGDLRFGSDNQVLSDPQATEIKLKNLCWRDFADDFFTSAFPSPQRGDTPTLKYGAQMTFDPLQFDTNYKDGLNISVGARKDDLSDFAGDIGYNASAAASLNFLTDDTTFHIERGADTIGRIFSSGGDSASTMRLGVKLPALTATLGDVTTRDFKLDITLNQIRELAISQTELEKMAKTDGSYAEFGLTFFGRAAKSAFDYRPVYLGGTSQPIIFTEVLQTTPTQNSPLGTYGGHGISYNDNGFIGSCDCDDYGFIMLVASVMPDTYYSQGLNRLWTKKLQSEYFLPDRAKLGMQPILNRELYFDGTVEDDNLFAYQDIFDEYRYTPNKIHGKLADPDALDFFPYSQSRLFQARPTFSQSFATTKNNVRMDFLSALDEIPFTAQFKIGCRAVRPLPYRAIPASII